MRQLCPNCSRLIELPETAAGTDAVCPECQRSFRVPGAYTPAVDPAAGPAPAAPTRPVPPPGFVPPTPPAPQPEPTQGSLTRSAGLSIAPNIVAWIPAACLTLVFLLSFFSWIGSYPGGGALYTQSPWGSLIGRFSVGTLDPVLLQDEGELKTNSRSTLMLVFYFFLLIATLIAAWAERIFSTRLHEPPGAVKGVWQLRYTILAGLAGGLLLILLLQSWSGFSLEQAAEKTVELKFAEARSQAKQADKSAETNRVAVQAGQELGKYSLQTTTAYSLAAFAHILAVLALVLAWWLDRRGTKPPPRIEWHW